VEDSQGQVIFVFELFIAVRHLTSRRRQTILSVMAIGLAVMTLMVSQALMVGFTQELYGKTVDKMPHVTVKPKSGEDYIHLYQDLTGKIGNIEEVKGVSPVLEGQATFKYKDLSRNIKLQGILIKDYDVLRINEDMIEGSLRDLETIHNSVILGDKLAEKLKVKTGDKVDSSFPEANPTTMEVVGIYHRGTPDDESLALVSLSTAQHFFSETNVVNRILIRAENPDQAPAISFKINNFGYPASSWEETNPEILQTIRLESLSNDIMLGLIVVIASFGIVSTLFMVVMEKTREIGMLMAMGASRTSIMKIFLMESGIIGFIGAVMGVAAGILISSIGGPYTFQAGQELYAGVSKIPFVVRAQDAVVIILFTFFLNLIAGVYPARRASRLDPVEAIHVE
jgi:lipoprotein-releasing system permease protein